MKLTNILLILMFCWVNVAYALTLSDVLNAQKLECLNNRGLWEITKEDGTKEQFRLKDFFILFKDFVETAQDKFNDHEARIQILEGL